MKNCCFCWSPVGGDAVEIQEGRVPPDADVLTGFAATMVPRVGLFAIEDLAPVPPDYAHLECFERAKTAYRTATVAVATMRGAR